jgi:hypothetical protein
MSKMSADWATHRRTARDDHLYGLSNEQPRRSTTVLSVWEAFSERRRLAKTIRGVYPTKEPDVW